MKSRLCFIASLCESLFFTSHGPPCDTLHTAQQVGDWWGLCWWVILLHRGISTPTSRFSWNNQITANIWSFFFCLYQGFISDHVAQSEIRAFPSFFPSVRSSCGSRTWSGFTLICSAVGATWPVCRVANPPTPNAYWASLRVPLSWPWDDWASSLSLPSMHWYY